MAGLTITVGGNDITAYVAVRSIEWKEVATDRVATCSFFVRDHSGTVSISPKDTVDIDDDGTTVFAGVVATVDKEQAGPAKLWLVRCQDNNILLEETVIESESYAAGVADSFILGDSTDGLFPQYRSDINAVTYVSTLDASMEAVAFAGMTLRECLDDLAKRTGARYYVDFDKYLHWFSTESNPAAFSLSTSPSPPTSYPFGGFKKVEDAARLADYAFVLGKGVSGWYPSSPSYVPGEYHAVSRDQRIETAQGVTDRGTAIVARYGSARETFHLWTEQDGLRAGMSVTLVNATWSINASYYIREVRMAMIGTDGDKRRYYLELNDEGIDAADAQRARDGSITVLETQINATSDHVFDTDAPSAPTFVDGNLTTGVTEDADGHQVVWIKATWGSVSDSDLDHYEIQCADNNSFNWPRVQHVQAGDTREVIFEGLVGSTDHYLRVRAVDWVGNYSAWSPQPTGYLTKTTAADTSAPAQVAGLSAASSRTLVGLQWTANSEADLSYYEIQRADDDSGSPDTYATIAVAKLNYYIDEDFTDGEIAAEDTFWYRVRAVDTSGNEGTWATQTSVSLSRLTDDHIAANTITAASIAANTITASEIAANTITASEIAASTITATELNISTLSAITADMGTLTAGEIRVGTGSVGVDFTGFRIMSSYIAGYDSDTLQAGIRASDGKLIAGGGDVILDASGLILTEGTGNTNKIRWLDGATTVASIDGYLAGSDGALQMVTSGASARITLQSEEVIYVTRLLIDSDDGVIIDALEGGVDDLRVAGGLYVGGTGTAPVEDWIHADGGVFVNETANAEMTIGLTINQGANDDEILALKSSDVAHGMTDETETDTYATLQKSQLTSGGVSFIGYKDADGTAGYAVNVVGRLGEAADTTKSAAGEAIVMITSQVKSGTTITTPGADANIFGIRSHTSVKFLFDAEGEMHCDAAIGAGNDWDEWDDLALAADLSRLPRARWQEMMRYSAEDFERAGLLTLSEDEDGRHAFIRVRAHLQFYACCFREVAQRLAVYERALLGLGVNLEALEAQ